jgi:hypothetical protein
MICSRDRIFGASAAARVASQWGLAPLVNTQKTPYIWRWLQGHFTPYAPSPAVPAAARSVDALLALPAGPPSTVRKYWMLWTGSKQWQQQQQQQKQICG